MANMAATPITGRTRQGLEGDALLPEVRRPQPVRRESPPGAISPVWPRSVDGHHPVRHASLTEEQRFVGERPPPFFHDLSPAEGRP